MSSDVKVASATPPLPRKVDYFARGPRTRASSHNALAFYNSGPKHTANMPRYVLDEVIGSGSFADVFRGLDMFDGAVVAIKRTKVNNEEHRDVLGSMHAGREVGAMMHLKHKYIVRMVDSFMDASLHIVFEFAEHGDLFDWVIAKYGQVADYHHRPVVCARTLTRISRQTGSALAYCHSLRVAQRDFKPENVIVVQKEPNIKVKIVDFGLSYGVYYAENDAPKTREKVGSIDYAAPELFAGRGLLDPYKTDVWAYGIVMYVLAHYELPWAPSNERHRPEKFPKNLAREIGPHVRDGLRGIIEQALQFCPDDRPTMDYLAAKERICEDEAHDTFSVLQIFSHDGVSDNDSDSDIPPPPPPTLTRSETPQP